MLPSEVTVVIATHPPRNMRMLSRAIMSVGLQTQQPAAIVIANDTEHEGSAITRNRALMMADTDFVAFLDSDDQFLPLHLELLMEEQRRTHADVVYSLPKVMDHNGDEIPRAWDWGGAEHFDGKLLERKAYIQTTSLVRREAALRVGGFEFTTDETGASNDDHGFYLKLYRAGYIFAHVHQQTFIWKHWGRAVPGRDGNTSGSPKAWA